MPLYGFFNFADGLAEPWNTSRRISAFGTSGLFLSCYFVRVDGRSQAAHPISEDFWPSSVSALGLQ